MKATATPEAAALAEALAEACKFRLFDEAVPRLVKCLGLMTDQEIWYRPNEQTVSAGNLVLHLCGNVGQWINHALGGAPDARVRDREFSERGPIPRTELLARLEKTMNEARRVIDGLDAARLAGAQWVQGREETGAGILVHVVEHFSYHVGQVTYRVKSRKAIDTGYYAGADLSQTGPPK